MQVIFTIFSNCKVGRFSLTSCEYFKYAERGRPGNYLNSRACPFEKHPLSFLLFHFHGRIPFRQCFPKRLCLILSLVSNNNDFLFSVGGMCLTRSFLFASVIVLIFLRRRQLFWPLMIYATAFAFLISYLPLMLSAKINAIVMFSVAILGGLLLIALRFRKKDKLDSGLWVGCPAFLSLVPAVSLSMKADFTSEMPFWIPPLVVGFDAMIATGIIA